MLLPQEWNQLTSIMVSDEIPPKSWHFQVFPTTALVALKMALWQLTPWTTSLILENFAHDLLDYSICVLLMNIRNLYFSYLILLTGVRKRHLEFLKHQNVEINLYKNPKNDFCNNFETCREMALHQCCHLGNKICICICIHCEMDMLTE